MYCTAILHMPLSFYMYVEVHCYTNENSTYITLYTLFDSNIVRDTSAYASGSPETYFFPSVTGSMVQLECHVDAQYLNLNSQDHKQMAITNDPPLLPHPVLSSIDYATACLLDSP